MISFVSIIALGFFLGMRHATDPDHVIAVTTIVSQQKTVIYGALIGAIWGFGHTLTILLVGSGIILFNIVIPPRLGLAMEVSVGVMLILLGLLNISGMMPSPANRPELAHAGTAALPHHHFNGLSFGSGRSSAWIHDYAADQEPASGMEALVRKTGSRGILRPLVVGIVHGLAGSAAVALLVLTTIRSPYWAVAYLLVFGIGTVAGMMLITAVIAVPFALSDGRFHRLNRAFGMLSALASLCFGLFLVYQMGFVDGLLSSHPTWMPR